MKYKTLNKEIYSYSNDDLVVEVERGFNLGYWDKALIPELKKRFKEIEKQEKLLEFYKKLNNLYEELYAIELSELALNGNFYEIEIIKLKYQIKELENGKV